MANGLPISTRSADYPGEAASIRLGGVTVYSASDAELDESIQTVAVAIDRCSQPHLSLTRTTLNSEVRKHLNLQVERRIFGAILGSQLRLGILDSVPCAAATGKVFRVYVNRQQVNTFLRHLDTVACELRGLRRVHVRDIEGKLFGERRWGTWSSTSHVLARLVQIGRACYADQSSFLWPAGIENAIE